MNSVFKEWMSQERLMTLWHIVDQKVFLLDFEPEARFYIGTKTINGV